MGQQASGRIETILADMKQSGFRRSVAREALLSALMSSHKPVSAPALMETLRISGTPFNKTTVYRELETLKRAGHVKELTLRSDMALYELAGAHHHHLTCVSCGEVRDVELGGSLCRTERTIAEQEGFRILDHSFEFFGLCGKCS